MECRRENLPIEFLDAYSKVRSSYRVNSLFFPYWKVSDYTSWRFIFCLIDGSFLCQKYTELKMELSRTERHILKEMGFICHVEHPHKFISNYLVTLGTPVELRQEAWNLANDR